MKKPVQVLAHLLEEFGINPEIHGVDITFFYYYTSVRCGNHVFRSQAHADTELAAAEFWLSHFPNKDGGEATLQAKLKTINDNPAMLDSGVRWMRFIFNQEHLGFVGQLNKKGMPFDEDTARRRLNDLIKLMESELPTLLKE